MEERISGHTGLLALIGSPVGHSGSPAMYNYSFAKLGLDYAYVAFDVKEDQVKEALDAVKLFHMRGINVTMPDKTEAAKYVDELSPAAQIIGAVNTIVNDDGRLTGYITDGEGFVHNLKDHGVDIKGKKITVAGGGGAATAIQVQCALDGAREITIFNIKDAFFERTLQTAEKIRKAVPGIVVNVYDIADTAKMTEEITSSDIFANATIVGMKPMDDQSVVKDLSAFRPGLVVCDAVYNPAETKLLREAKEAGMPISKIFETYGELYFRELETKLIQSLNQQEPTIVSCGGGVAMRQENVDCMRDGGSVVFLTATPQTIYERVKNSTDRPLLNGHMNVAYISELMEVRRPKYEAAADILVATDGKTKEEIAEEIIGRLEE